MCLREPGSVCAFNLTKVVQVCLFLRSECLGKNTKSSLKLVRSLQMLCGSFLVVYQACLCKKSYCKCFIFSVQFLGNGMGTWDTFSVSIDQVKSNYV